MYLEKFNAFHHLEVINSWLVKHQCPTTNANELPAIGYVVLERGEAIACAFLRHVEGGIVAHLDGLATNPDAPGDMRHTAIDMVVSRIMEKAKENNYKAVFSYSVDRSTLLRSVKHGFEVMPHVLIVADLHKKA